MTKAPTSEARELRGAEPRRSAATRERPRGDGRRPTLPSTKPRSAAGAPRSGRNLGKTIKFNPENLARSTADSGSAALRVVVAAERSRLGRIIDGTDGWDGLVERLSDLSKELREGKLTSAEEMLMHQAVALQSLFVRLTESAWLSDGAEHFDLKMRYAFRAQAQCRATLETLAAVKNPPVVFAKQANLTTGPQQVNNGAGTIARVRPDAIEPTKLSGVTSELHQNGGTPTHEGPADSPVAALGAIDRAADTGRQGPLLEERMEGRSERRPARSRPCVEANRTTISPGRLINGRY